MSWNDWTDVERQHYMKGAAPGIRPMSYGVGWKDLTDEEREHWTTRGMCPYDRSQDPTAEEMCPVYEARGYKRKPDTVRGFWDQLTDEEYALRFKHFPPEALAWSLRRSGTDGIVTHPETLEAVAKIAVRAERDRESGRVKQPEVKPSPLPESPEPKLPKQAPQGWDPGKPYSPAMLITHLMGVADGRCGICGKLIKAASGPNRPSVDHVIPSARGGQHAMSNLQVAHLSCNNLKGYRNLPVKSIARPGRSPNWMAGA